MPTPGQEARPLIYPLPHLQLPPICKQITPRYQPLPSATFWRALSPPPPHPPHPHSKVFSLFKAKARDFHSQILQSRPPPLSLMQEFWATSLSEITWQIS